MIRLENITFRYPGDFPPALLNLNLEFATGEWACVMGSNGSGKSTFAKLTAGLLKSQQGRIAVASGKDNPIPVGLLFQNPDNQIVAVTVEKEIAFALENLGVKQIEMEKRISRVLQSFSIEHLRRRLTAELSVGEKQRVALAALFVFNPPVLILDEPDSFLDAEGKLLFRKQLERVKEKKPDLTVIEITQYPNVAKSFDRLVVLKNGRVVADSSPAEILSDKLFCINCGIDFDGSSTRKIELPAANQSEVISKVPTVYSIAFKRVSFKYPHAEHFVFQNVTATFKSEEITAIVGPSGSGKSTMGMLLCGIFEPNSGNIHWQDQSEREIEKKKAAGRVTASLQQPERQFFLNTCLQEVEFGPKNFGRKVTRKGVQGLFEMAGLSFEEFHERDPFTLSLGEKRRLAFASTLSIFPDFIIFDEPSCALDREGVGRFILLAKALREAGMGVIIISHDEDIVRTLADFIIAFDGKGNFRTLTSESYFQSEKITTSASAKYSS